VGRVHNAPRGMSKKSYPGALAALSMRGIVLKVKYCTGGVLVLYESFRRHGCTFHASVRVPPVRAELGYRALLYIYPTT